MSCLPKGFTAISHYESANSRARNVFHAVQSAAPKTAQRLAYLHEYKGCLIVGWRSEPDHWDLRLLRDLWGAQNECALEHVLEDGTRLRDATALHPDNYDWGARWSELRFRETAHIELVYSAMG